MKLSPRYTDKQWTQALDPPEDWERAIAIVEDRLDGRWFDVIDRMLNESYSGFAILALDCIALESLWGFKNGRPIPRGGERQAYRAILTVPPFGWSDALSDRFRLFVRNGLMHDAETRNGWLVEKTVPSGVMPRRSNDGSYVLNRTAFHKALKGAYRDWLKKVRGGDVLLRTKMCARMNEIVATHYA